MSKLKEVPKTVKIEVTATDIRLGKQQDPRSCAIARAVKRTMGDSPSVDGTEFDVTINDRTYYYDMPKKAGTFVDKFDTDKSKVKPFTFTATRTEL